MEATVSADLLHRLSREATAPVPVARNGVSRLRPPHPRDADRLVQAGNDPVAREMTELPIPYEHGHADEFIAEAAVAPGRDGSLTAYVIADEDDDLLGVVSLHDIDSAAVAAVGYWVAPWARGRGIASTGLAALVGWAFDVVGLRRLLWQSLVGNLASLHVATEVGFRPEGTCWGVLRQRSDYVDCWSASLGPDDPREPDRLRRDVWVEIAAGAWQLQPIATRAEGIAAEAALPISAALPSGVWAVKDSVSAEPGAYVALLADRGRGWVISVPSTAGDDAAVELGRGAVARFAGQALGLQLP
ncbi:MAG: GNAT family N-acetyltransferase [Actinobacteria bacterium]|nr:GNAT family N-acetyltransferase [Actinomycetota bacterium]